MAFINCSSPSIAKQQGWILGQQILCLGAQGQIEVKCFTLGCCIHPGGMKVKDFGREKINERRRQQSEHANPLALYPQKSFIIVVKPSAWLKIRESLLGAPSSCVPDQVLWKDCFTSTNTWKIHSLTFTLEFHFLRWENSLSSATPVMLQRLMNTCTGFWKPLYRSPKFVIIPQKRFRERLVLSM